MLEVRCDYNSHIDKLLSDQITIKGRLKQHVNFWSDIGASPMILSIINDGYRIPFTDEPPPMFCNNNRSARLEYSFVTKSILELLSSNRITEKSVPSYITSPLSVAQQASGKKRLILDLSKLNKFVQKTSFKLDDWKTGLQYLSKGALMFTFDLISSYHHIEISQHYQKYLGFSWIIDGNCRFFEFTVLPFGLTSAPLLFTKTLKPLVTHWRACGILIALYLDDGFIIVPRATGNLDSDRLIARSISKHVRVDLLRAGFVYSIEKSKWDPSTHIEWFGMIWNTQDGTLKVLERRIEKINRTISEIQALNHITIRKLHSFVGQIISLSPVCGSITRLMSRHCQIEIANASDEDDIICLNEHCKRDIKFWKDNVHLLNVRHVFANQTVSKIVCCDASSTGSGAIICNDIHTAHKLWTEAESQKSSTWRELNTILFAIISFLPIIQNSQLKVFTDSQTAARIVEVGSMNQELQNLSFHLFQTCLQNNIKLEVQWIPRDENEQADLVSRLVYTDDWMISDSLFQMLKDRWGPFTIDCFACHYNTKLPRFYSRFWNPGTEGVDAFSQDWSGENCLLVPPVVLIPSVLKHIHSCKGKGTLVFPWWPSSVFWPLLWSCYTPWIKGFISFEGSNLLQQGRNKNSLLGSQYFTGAVCAVNLDFIKP